MADGSVNLPDLLGTITGGERANLDVVQCAIAVSPVAPAAGSQFDAVVLLQNASDVDVDVSVRLHLPERDASRNRNRFFGKQDPILVGLRPAEVGYLLLPLSCSSQTAPADDYALLVDFSVKRMNKARPTRVREREGGGVFNEMELAEDVQQHIWKLQQMIFSVQGAGRSSLTTEFGVGPATLGKVKERGPEWVSLWTMRDHVDDAVLMARVQEHIDTMLPNLSREVVFYPLLDAVQTRFRSAGYPLLPGEAVFVTKALTLVLENTATMESEHPAWLMRACRLLFDQPEAARNVPFLVTEIAFLDLVGDAVRLGLTMLETVIGEDYGDEHEHDRYAQEVIEKLRGGGIDLRQVYLPLVLSGLIANTRVVMDKVGEMPRETVSLLEQDKTYRAETGRAAVQPLLAMAAQLIDRALEQTGY
ncbi:MAG: hypothetical protein JW910_16725 [Anaerolineae bacterium]|nr:hypothetical protein [Anaerolineae bacterium]